MPWGLPQQTRTDIYFLKIMLNERNVSRRANQFFTKVRTVLIY